MQCVIAIDNTSPAKGLYQFTFSQTVKRCGYSPHLQTQNRLLTFWTVDALKGNKLYLTPDLLFISLTMSEFG